MRTRAELVSIQALSAELLASAACCSSLAGRTLWSEAALEGLDVPTVVWAAAICARHGARNAMTRAAISRFPMSKCFLPGAKWRQPLLFYDAPTLSPAASPRKFNLFIGSIRKCYGRWFQSDRHGRCLLFIWAVAGGNTAVCPCRQAQPRRKIQPSSRPKSGLPTSLSSRDQGCADSSVNCHTMQWPAVWFPPSTYGAQLADNSTASESDN